MSEVTWATPLYEFLRLSNASALERTVLDCGAGGDQPPLSLFYQHGYKTCGVELAEAALDLAQSFCEHNQMPLNIIRGDMRRIPFSDETFSNVYSYNAIFFMTKTDIAKAMVEIKRVLKVGGLFFVNFMSLDDPDNEPFRKDAPLIRVLKSDRFSKFDDEEADPYFADCVVLRKEKRILNKLFEGRMLTQVTLEYIARKHI